MATGYSSTQITASDVAAVHPDAANWTHASQTMADVIALAFADVQRDVRDACRRKGQDLDQIVDASVFKRAEVYKVLQLICQQNVVPDASGPQDALAMAKYWKRLYEDELKNVTWEIDTTVDLATTTTERRKRRKRFYRG